jgi:osmotically inducible protein OsmC
MQRTAQAHWHGDLKSGAGNLTTASKTLSQTPYSFVSRFEQGQGTNPEELLAAAHAGCFTMAVSAQLTTAGHPPESLDTTCTITLERKDGGFTITESRLEMKAKVPGITPDAFQKVVEEAKTGCPVSKLFHTNITLNTQLDTQRAGAA